MEPILYMTEWFLCVYTRTLPWESILRVWDMFLCEGVKVIFKVGLVLLKGSLGRTSLVKRCPTTYETLQVLRNPSQHIMEEEALIYQVNINFFFYINIYVTINNNLYAAAEIYREYSDYICVYVIENIYKKFCYVIII